MERFVRKATAKDLPVVLNLIESGRRIMRENGNTHQWGDCHPTVAQIEEDMADGCSYLLIEGRQSHSHLCLHSRTRCHLRSHL